MTFSVINSKYLLKYYIAVAHVLQLFPTVSSKRYALLTMFRTLQLKAGLR